MLHVSAFALQGWSRAFAERLGSLGVLSAADFDLVEKSVEPQTTSFEKQSRYELGKGECL